jgi:hypothetical protein
MSALASDILESVREPGTARFSPANFARLLDLQQQDLAALAHVHRNTIRTHPESPKLQEAMRVLARVLSAAMQIQPDASRAIYLIKNEPVAAFQHKTLLHLVQENRADDAVAYLESIASGFVG